MASAWRKYPYLNGIMAYKRENSNEPHFAEVEEVICDGNFWRVHSRGISLRFGCEGWCEWTNREQGIFEIDGIPGEWELVGFLPPPESSMAA